MEKHLQKSSQRIIETVLVFLLLLILLWALYDVLKIFLGVLTFALIFTVSFSGLFESMVKLFNGRRKLTAIIFTILLMAVVALPLVYIISQIRIHLKEVIDWLSQLRNNGASPLPNWITNFPLVGDEITSWWAQFQSSPKDLMAVHGQQVHALLRSVWNGSTDVAGTLLQIIIGIVISGFFLAAGERLVVPVITTVQYLLGKKDGMLMLTATQHAIRSVSIGVIGTALIAAVLSWIGLTIAGMSFALILSVIIFFLVLVQLGPLWVWVPVVIWSGYHYHTGTTVFLIVYGIVLLVIDALLKPVLIAKSGGKLPFLVLFIGVIGGFAAWGFTGLFKGAIIMAVFYTVFTSWLEKKHALHQNANPPGTKPLSPGAHHPPTD
jgi:predicted PurR-regulated permease PerM